MRLNCVAIAYDWVLAPPTVTDHDVTLLLATSCVEFDPEGPPSDLESSWKSIRSNETSYHALFPPKSPALDVTDVSGTLGLLWPTSDKVADLKAEAFERLLADAILWTLAEMRFEPEKKHVILMQGPMIPKLRGRLLYLGISPDIPIYAVTYHTQWFGRMEGARSAFESLQLTGRKGPRLGAVYPPKAIDHSTRSWVCISGQGEPLHYEVIANMWNSCETPLWLDDRQKELLLLSAKKVLFEDTDKAVHLPGPLGVATETVRSLKEWEKSFIRLARLVRDAEHQGISVEKLHKNVTEIFPGCISSASITSAPTLTGQRLLIGEAATEQRIVFDEPKAYEQFRNARHDKKFATMVKAVLKSSGTEFI